MVSREEAAATVGCTPRTITRWAEAGRLVKYLDVLGRVRFDREAVGAMARAWTPPAKPVPTMAPDPPKRW